MDTDFQENAAIDSAKYLGRTIFLHWNWPTIISQFGDLQ